MTTTPPAVAFLTTDWSPNIKPLQPGGCAWYRCALPATELATRGWRVGFGMPWYELATGFGMQLEPGRVVNGWDAVVLKLLMAADVPHHVKEARARGQVVIVDVDDYYAGLSPDNQAHAYTDPATNPYRNRSRYELVIAAADVVVTSTPFLRDYYAERHPDVRLIRNGIDLGRWTRIRDKAGTHPTIGWVGGIPWRSGDLETMRPWLPDFLARHGLRAHHGGHVPRGDDFAAKTGVPAELVSTARMRPIMDYPTLFDGFQIGVVPLNPIDFNVAKSTIKGLEYAAAGIPFVAAATPEYVRLAELGVGRVAATPEEWVAHLTELLDPRVRKKEAARNRALVSTDHTIRSRAGEWAELFAGVTRTGD